MPARAKQFQKRPAGAVRLKDSKGATARRRPAAAEAKAKQSPPTGVAGHKRPVFVSFPGAGGGRSRHDCLKEFGTLVYASFSGQPNLTSLDREEPFLQQVLDAAESARLKHAGSKLYLVGHSFGSRTIVHLLKRADFRKRLPAQFAGALLFGYPLVHQTQQRELALQAVPAEVPLLFISGTRDSFMGDFSLLEKTLSIEAQKRGQAADVVCRASKRRRCCLVAKVASGDHGLHCPKAQEEDASKCVRSAVAEFLTRTA